MLCRRNAYRILLAFPSYVCIFLSLFSLGSQQHWGNMSRKLASDPKQDFLIPENGKPQSVITITLGLIFPGGGTFLVCVQLVCAFYHCNILFQKLFNSKLYSPASDRMETRKLMSVFPGYSRVLTLWGNSVNVPVKERSYLKCQK